jgi:aminoglycoside 2'-N-acetyltransferase I
VSSGEAAAARSGRRAAASIDVELVTLRTQELDARRVDALIALCGRAFREPFEQAWNAVGAGTHVIAEVDGRPVGHALLIERAIEIGLGSERPLRSGYLENVASEPRLHGRGIGSAVMRRMNELIDRYELGALATGSNAFYERLGWMTWRGPVYVRHGDRRERLEREDGRVMVRFTPLTPAGLEVEAAISVEGRAWNAW